MVHALHRKYVNDQYPEADTVRIFYTAAVDGYPRRCGTVGRLSPCVPKGRRYTAERSIITQRIMRGWYYRIQSHSHTLPSEYLHFMLMF